MSTARFLATKRSVFVGKGSTDSAYRVLTNIMRNTGLIRKVSFLGQPNIAVSAIFSVYVDFSEKIL